MTDKKLISKMFKLQTAHAVQHKKTKKKQSKNG